MTRISPLLQNRLEANKNGNSYHSSPVKIGDVKPNLPKAKLIRENAFESAVSAVKDTFQDGKNFFKAAKTGKMNDNNLGRINDLGMKAGALLIASYLAAHAKTKTDAIMQFIGGTTFFASMALWPKIALNLPARLVHGFRIDHKYLSAQGDKKDLGLDNQFQPMDIFSDEEMMEMAKKAGIDPNDEFAREKMQRKLQKTMLQNRTLWMATAGFATPLMTSLIGSAVEPKVRKAVIDHGVKKTREIIFDEQKLTQYLDKSKPIITNKKELQKLFNGMDEASLDKDFYQKLAETLSLNKIFEQFKDPDDIKPISSLESEDIISSLKQMREDKSFVSKDNLIALAAGMKPVAGESIDSFTESVEQLPIGEKAASELFSSLGDKVSLTEARRALQARFGEGQIEEAMAKVKADNSKFFGEIKEFNSGALGALRGRLKAYMDLVNPVIGSKSESAYTADFTETMKSVFEALGIKNKDYKFMQKATVKEQQEFLSSKIQGLLTKRIPEFPEKLAELDNIVMKFTSGDRSNSENLKELRASLAKLFGEDFYLVKNDAEFNNFVTHIQPDNTSWKGQIVGEYIRKGLFVPKFNPDIQKTVDALADSNNLNKIAGESDAPLTKALLGGRLGGQSTVVKFIQNFITNKKIDLASTKYKPLVAISFEERLLRNDFSDLTKSEIEALKDIVYDGTVSLRNNKAEIRNQGQYYKLINHFFDSGKFAAEEHIAPGIKKHINALKDVTNGDTYTTAKYFTAGSFADLTKNFATRINESKTWAKIFFPMAIALVAVTLLVQPLFGKIDNEFPKKTKKEGVDNGNK